MTHGAQRAARWTRSEWMKRKRRAVSICCAIRSASSSARTYRRRGGNAPRPPQYPAQREKAAISAISEAEACLNGGDEGLGAVSAIKEAEDALRSLRALVMSSLSFRTGWKRCAVKRMTLPETNRDKKDEYDFSPQELDAVESRCDQLYRLKKKYGSSVEEMLAYLEKVELELVSGRSLCGSWNKSSGRRRAPRVTRRRFSRKSAVRRRKSWRRVFPGNYRDRYAEASLFHRFSGKGPRRGRCGCGRVSDVANVGEALRPIRKNLTVRRRAVTHHAGA